MTNIIDSLPDDRPVTIKDMLQLHVLMIASTDDLADELNDRLNGSMENSDLVGISTQEIMTALRDRIVLLSGLVARIDSATLVGSAFLASATTLDGYEDV